MEGEIVFYDQAEIEAWAPREYVPLVEDTISPLGQLFAAWNAIQRRTIDEYDHRRHWIDTHFKQEVICPDSNADARARRRSRRTFATAFITDSSVSTDDGARDLPARVNPS